MLVYVQFVYIGWYVCQKPTQPVQERQTCDITNTNKTNVLPHHCKLWELFSLVITTIEI